MVAISRQARRQVIRKMVSVQSNERYDEASHSSGDLDIVADYVTSLLYKFVQFERSFNIMLVLGHSYDVQPFHDKFLREFGATVLTSQDDRGAWEDYRKRQSNVLVTYKKAMFAPCAYTDMIIFIDYLPSLDDYTHAISNLRDGCGFCYLVFDPETVELDDMSSRTIDLQECLESYRTTDSGMDPLSLDPNMQLLLSMLEMEENTMQACNYYDTVIY
ncbi:AaceriAEL133CAp [[Ashbya] aceris (nom. inval.)]|nr:AaceriAEL133CAp [[Ashbya] aceris (nom. inval.)]